METSGLTAPLIPKLNEYEGSISDVSSDGSVDYRGRPADKATFGRWKAVSFILGAVILERLAYYGIASNLISYLTIKLHQGTAEAVTNVWIWGGVAWLMPLLGGFIADSFLGRYWTITYSLLIYIMGMVFLTVTVSVPGLKPPECSPDGTCEPASEFQVRMFYIALYTVAVGVGGIKPCFSSLGADQFEEQDSKERLMKHSYFNYWWVAVTIGSFLALTVLVYLEDRVSYGWGYGIPTAGLAVATAVFLLGTRAYRYKLPRGSPLTQVARVLVAALRNHHVQATGNPSLLHEGVEVPHKRTLAHSENLGFLDKAAIVTGSKEQDTSSKWRVCTVTEVEEVKLLIQVLPVWFTTLIFMVTCQQTSTFFLRQGLTLDPTIGSSGFRIPPASLELACVVTALVLIPVYDRHIVPYLRRCTGDERGLSLLQRMGVGLVITVAAMAVAAVVEARRLTVVQNEGLEFSEEVVPMSVAWLVPQYCIIGVAQVFAYMGQLEFFYDQVPDDMQTIGTALFTSNTGVAHFVCAWILRVITRATGQWSGQPWIVSNLNQSRLDKYYWLLALLSALNCVAFFWVSLGYKYKTSDRRHDHSRHNTKVVPDEALLLD